MRQGRRRIYAGVLDIPEGRSGGVTITHKNQPAGWETQSGNMRTALFGQRSEAITFEEPTRWHELAEDGQGVWMTDLPIEQRQMDELITKAKGRVLVGGLGVGYAVVALAQRPAVKKIVVVEKSADIIKLVWDATMAKVPDPSKCEIIQADLFTFLGSLSKNAFTWALFDIWQADGETCFHEVVVPLRRLAHGKVRSVVCWNEDVMRGQLWNGMRTRMMLLTLPPHPEDKDGMMTPSLDALADVDSKSVYIKWSAPFWRWYREHKDHLTPDYLEFIMGQYCVSYGRPEMGDGLGLLHDVPSHIRRDREGVTA